MDLGKTLLLGFIAGVTIVLGLPVGRLRRPLPSLRLMLNAIAIGILIFLVWDVLTHAWEPVDAALVGVHDNTGGLGPVFGYGSLFTVGLAGGLIGLVAYDKYLTSRVARARRAGPGAMAVSEKAGPVRGVAAWSAARRLAFLIAVGIGLHNFAEGLAIGQSAASGEVALATVLVIGFALHNATEGFGIVAPLAGDLDAEGNTRCVSSPPTTGPSAVPITPAAIQRATPRRSPSAATSSSRQPTRATAPPSACTHRAPIRTGIEPANAQIADAAANTAIPTAHSGAGLRRENTHAAGTTTIASTRLNAMSTQATWPTVPFSRRRISGNASVTIAESASTNPTVNASRGTAARCARTISPDG
jgi:ZIP family zinc transporter